MATKTDKKPAARPKRSKAETQRAFDDIQAELAVDEGADAKSIESERVREQDIRAGVEGVSVETVVQRMAGLGLDVSRSLADLTEKLTAEVKLLSAVREAVAIEHRELERLHKLDIAATALDQLIEEYAEKREQLDTEIAEQRASWATDATKVERDRREQDEALKKQRQREVEDYEYRKTLERKKAQDKYDEEQRLAERKNAERQEALDKDWQRREAALKQREDEVAALQAEVAAFPARLSQAVEAARKDVRAEVESQLERQILILKKDAEAEARVAQLSIKALEQSLAAGAAQIAALEKQLGEAKQQVQDIAVRAIDGASGARALTHINQIAMEQAKNRPQG